MLTILLSGFSLILIKGSHILCMRVANKVSWVCILVRPPGDEYKCLRFVPVPLHGSAPYGAVLFISFPASFCTPTLSSERGQNQLFIIAGCEAATTQIHNFPLCLFVNTNTVMMRYKNWTED